MEITTCSSSDKQRNVAYSNNGILFRYKKEQGSDTCCHMDKLQKLCTVLSEKARPERSLCTMVLCNSIYIKCPQQTNPQEQKVKGWLPAAGGRGGWMETDSHGSGLSLARSWKSSGIKSSDVCTTRWIHKIHWAVYFLKGWILGYGNVSCIFLERS